MFWQQTPPFTPSSHFFSIEDTALSPFRLISRRNIPVLDLPPLLPFHLSSLSRFTFPSSLYGLLVVIISSSWFWYPFTLFYGPPYICVVQLLQMTFKSALRSFFPVLRLCFGLVLYCDPRAERCSYRTGAWKSSLVDGMVSSSPTPSKLAPNFFLKKDFSSFVDSSLTLLFPSFARLHSFQLYINLFLVQASYSPLFHYLFSSSSSEFFTSSI